MRAQTVSRLDKLGRRLPPTWDELFRWALIAGDKMNQAELDAYLAYFGGRATPQQQALWDEWLDRNLPRIWAVWDEKYPGWQDAPFWKELSGQGET